MKHFISYITKAALAAALVFFSIAVTAQTLPQGLSVDNDFAEGEDGYYYVNMTKDKNTDITIPVGFTSTFKVYDNGGKNGEYQSSRSYGYVDRLKLTAPEGYKFQLTGWVHTNKKHNARVSFYEGSHYSNIKLGKGDYGDDPKEDIGTVVSSGNILTIEFYTGSTNSSRNGFDISVSLITSETSYTISINDVTGGTISSNVTTQKVGEMVTLTSIPSSNYLLNDITVTDANNNIIALDDDLRWYSGSNTASFVMPGSAVTVAPSYTNNWTATDGGLSVTMLSSGNLDANIPNGVQSFKVKYDGLITDGKTSSLKMTAPEGYLIQLSGSVSLSSRHASPGYRHVFEVYDGKEVSSPKLEDITVDDEANETITTISTGNSMSVCCNNTYGNSEATYTLDLIATLIPDNTTHSILVNNSISHGRVVTDLTSAKANTKVSITVTPDEGYVLKSINVTDANGNITLSPSSPNASFGDVNYYTGSNFSFTMRSTDATVSATFMSKKDFYVRIPATGQRSFTVPEGITEFKVTHTSDIETGPTAGYYFVNYNGYLLVTAPEGYIMNVRGDAYIFKWSSMLDYLQIYDGSTTDAESLGQFWCQSYPEEIYPVSVSATSTGNQLLFYFYADDSGYDKGFTLTVKLIEKPISLSDLSIAEIPDQTFTGSAIKPEITVKDGEKTLVLGTDFTVEYSDNINTGTATATITGKGKYSGIVEKTFTIVPIITTIGALTITEDENGKTAEINGNYTAVDALTLTEDITVTSVTFDRTFTPGATSTIILPFAVESGNYEGGTFYEFTSVDYENDKWVASLTKVAGNLAAHKPYLFVPSSEKLTITGSVTFKATSAEEYEDTKGDWTFKGVFKKKYWETSVKTDYFFMANSGTSAEGAVLKAGDFVRVGNKNSLYPFRCYLSYTGNDSRLSKSDVNLPSTIEVRFIDAVASVTDPSVEPKEENPSGDIETPVSEIIPASGVKVWSFNKTVFIEAQPDMDYTIVDLNGRTLKKGVTNSTREEILLSRRVNGIVIVKIGKNTFKVNY